MEFVSENGKKYILISSQDHLNELQERISQDEPFADKFKFSEQSFFIELLESLEISHKDFTKKYYYYDPTRKLHISESEFDYVWISTAGLVAKSKPTTNRAVNSCLTQYLVISILFEKAIEIVKDERVYDIESYGSSQLSELSQAIFHNFTFYIEVFCKAYLSLTKIEAPHSHSLTLLYNKTVDTMVSNKHDDSLFQILVLDPLYKFVQHIGEIPGNFKEQFIKYDDNPLDDSVILFDDAGLVEMTSILELSVDFISAYYYEGTKTYYLKSDIYRRMMDKAETEEKKKKIRELYPHLADKKQK